MKAATCLSAKHWDKCGNADVPLLHTNEKLVFVVFVAACF